MSANGRQRLTLSAITSFITMKPKPLKEERVTIRLEPELKKALDKMAAAADLSLSHFIRAELKKVAFVKQGK